MTATATPRAPSQNGWSSGAVNRNSSYTPGMPSSRATSPLSSQRTGGPWVNDLFMQNASSASGNRTPGTKHSDLLSTPRIRTASVHSKGQKSERANTDSVAVYDLDSYSDRLNGSNTTFSTTENSLRSVHPEMSSIPKRSRTSFLGAASDALTFKKFAKKKKAHSPPQAIFLPEVIEITSTTNRESMIADTEEEERERLRDVAAQSIGLDPGIMSDRVAVLEDDSEEEMEHLEHRASASLEADEDPANELRFEPGPSQSQLSHRRRAGSLAHSAHHHRTGSGSITLPTVPIFPTTVSSLEPFTQMCAILPKHYPAPSLLKFSLSKQWKSRYIVMSSPAQAFAYNRPTSAPTVSYLHLFKTRGTFEKEIERMEINEDSVVFVNEHNEEIAGRKNVLRVGGVDCGAVRKIHNLEENGRTMWLLQIPDSQELQKWITAVKNSVLSQRSVRAGLGLPAYTLGGTEPRGDLDVMLSMRAQGLMSSPTKSGHDIGRSRGVSIASDRSVGHEQGIMSSAQSTQSASHSLRSQATPSPTKPSTAVSALKGLFSGSNRPRSPSVAAISTSDDQDQPEDSFSSVGNNLLTMLRTNQLQSDRSMSPLGVKIHSTPPASPSWSQIEPDLEKMLAQDTQPDQWIPFRHVAASPEQSPFTGSSPLQPPPRKRPLTSPLSTSDEISPTYRYINANSSTAESFGLAPQKPTISMPAASSPPSSPTDESPAQASPSQFSAVQSSLEAKERKPRVPSWSSSTSSFVSDASGSGSGSRRWSRQGNIPRMLTPPLGSPPPVPTFAEEAGATTPRMTSPHPYAIDRSPSQRSTNSQKSPSQSFVSAMHPFSKRASGASWQSTSTVSSHTRPATSNRSSSRLSIPPPQRPAPNTALPPTPNSDTHTPSAETKPVLRESFAQRAMRLSLIGPAKSPPSSGLPLLPDEANPERHRRSNSSSSVPSNLQTIPDSPHQPDAFGRTPTPPPRPSVDSNKRNSIKQRLRLLSAPASSTVSPQLPPNPQVITTDQSFLPSPMDPTDDSFTSVQTRLIVGEPITTRQNDPNFLLLASPSPAPPSWMTRPETVNNPEVSPDLPEMASLSPPPWRGSRRISIPTEDDDDTNSSASTPLAASPPPLSSAISIANLHP